MTGSLRGDYFEWLLEWETKADLCLSVGTSLAGMNADRVAEKTAKRCLKGQGLGTVIINLQRTRMDENSSLRIYGQLDHVLDLLATRLLLTLPPPFSPPYILQLDPQFVLEPDLYRLPAYDSDGNRKPQPDDSVMLLDLREDAQVKITHGMYGGHAGEMMGKNKEGHYNVRIFHPLKGTFKAPKVHTLGLWWLEAATKATVPTIPLVNVDDSLVFQ